MPSSSSVCVRCSHSTMELQWMLLLLLLLHAEANNLTEVKVVLGQSVTITCSDNSPDLYWFIQIYGNLSGFIGRTFSGTQEHDSRSPSDRTKFLLWGNSLNITKVTADDCRLYYCAKKNNSHIHYLDTFQLVTDVPPPPPPSPSRGSDSGRQEEQGSGSLLHSVLVLYGSLALNGLLILVTTGVVCVSLCLKKKKKSRDFQVDEPPPVTYETPQYEEIQFSSSVRPAAAAPECIYYKAQLPVCRLPPA